MIIQNNSSTRTYTVGGVTIDPGKQATVPDEYYDDIQGITDLQLIGVPPVNTAAMTRRSTQTLYNSDGTVYGIVSSDSIVSVTGRINPFTVGAGQNYSFAMKEGDVLTLTGNSTAVGVLARTGALNTVIGAGIAKFGPFSGVQIMNLATSAGSVDAAVVDGAIGSPQISQKGLILKNTDGINISIPYSRNRKGSLLFDFSDTANWISQSGGVTRSADATMTKRSASAIKLVFGAGASSDGIKKTFGTTFAIQSGTAMALVCYIDPATFGSTTATIKFSSDALATKSLAFTLTNNYLRPGWNCIPIRAGEDGTFESQAGTAWVASGGQAWGDQLNYFEIVFTGLASKTCWLDSFIVGAKAIPRWSFSTDSPDSTILTVIAPAFAANGWTATAFIDGDSTTVNANKNMLRTLIDTYGWEVGHQGITHTSYNSNGRDIGADWDTGVANFLAAGLPAPKMFAYPLNASSAANDAILAARGVIWRRGSGNPMLNSAATGCPNAPDGMVRAGWNQMLGTNLNTGTTYSQLVNRIAAMKFFGGIQHFFTHNAKPGVPDGLGIDLTQFYQWCDLMKAAEYTDGFQNVQCSQSKSILDSELFTY